MPDLFIEGIDVSVHQGSVAWGAVSQSGVSFAFARATVGAHQVDARFAANWKGIGDSGLNRGAYHYFWPATSWQDQAKNFINTVGPLQTGDLPPVLDLEEAMSANDPRKHDTWQDIPAGQRLPMIQSWLDAVEQALGIRPMIYTRQNFIEGLLGNGLQALSSYPLWIAHYNVPQPSFPPNWVAWNFWQYTEKGSEDGVLGNVDRNRFNGSLTDLQAFAKN